MDPITHEILVTLGTGGTTEMAERVHAWVAGHWPGLKPADIIGLAEVAHIIGRPTTVAKRITSDPDQSFPAPVTTLAATPIWDRNQVQTWADGNPPETTP